MTGHTGLTGPTGPTGPTGYYNPSVIYADYSSYPIQPPLFKNQQITIVNNRSGSTPGYYQSPKDSCNDIIYALDTFGDNIYVGGKFTIPIQQYIMGVNINNNTSFSLANGFDEYVLTIYYDTLSNRLYAGGQFKRDGYGTLLNYISYFNFSLNTWIPMGLNNGNLPGLNNIVYTITSLRTDEYIGGSFREDSNNVTLNRITRYDTITDTFYPLTTLTYGVKNIVYTVVYNNNDGYYYVGGNFQNAGGQQANNIARYNISNKIWEPLFDTTTKKNGVDGIVYTIFYDSNTSLIYVGGSFFKVSGNNYYNITSWNGSNWSYIGADPNKNGTNGPVFTITKDNNNSYLYIGGNFNYTNYNGTPTSYSNLFYNLAYWNLISLSWNYVGLSNLQNGTNDTVRALYFDNVSNTLYAGGNFTQVNYNVVSGSTDANYIGVWNGSSWSTIGSNGTNASVNSITGNNSGTIYVGGNFTIVDYGGSNQSANYIVIWNGASWISLKEPGNNSNGLNGSVNTLCYNNNINILYIGGLFTYAYLDTISTIVPYYNSVIWNLNDNTWNFIGDTQQMNGVNGEVFSIFNNINDNYTFIGGTFNLAGYDGINSMNKIQNITYFDGGSKWYPLNYHGYQPGVDGKEVFALAVIGDDIYVGGNFTYTAPIQTEPYNICNYIARWNTINEVWYPLNYKNGEIGLDNTVKSLSTNGTLLFVGGEFTYTSNGSIELNYIAIWDPKLETWTQIITTDNALNVGYGVNNSVLGLSCRFPYQTLYVSGTFTIVPNTNFELEYIASFNLNNVGTQQGFQQIIDSNDNIGTNSTTNTILDVYPRVYFGGEFTNVYPNNNITMNYLGYYLYIYISPEVVLYIQVPETPPRQFLDTQTGIISPTYTLTNRFKSVILINCEEENISPLKYWLIMYRS